jgi:hypothetical protein
MDIIQLFQAVNERITAMRDGWLLALTLNLMLDRSI